MEKKFSQITIIHVNLFTDQSELSALPEEYFSTLFRVTITVTLLIEFCILFIFTGLFGWLHSFLPGLKKAPDGTNVKEEEKRGPLVIEKIHCSLFELFFSLFRRFSFRLQVGMSTAAVLGVVIGVIVCVCFYLKAKKKQREQKKSDAQRMCLIF